LRVGSALLLPLLRGCLSRVDAGPAGAEHTRRETEECLGGGAGGSGVEVFAAEAVAVAFEAHQGNATLNYRSVLVRELTVEDAEIYRRSGHRRRSRRESVGGKRPENV
jgi:hypothetical protein